MKRSSYPRLSRPPSLIPENTHLRRWNTNKGLALREDHVEAIVSVLELGRSGDVYNIGGGTELTNISLR